MKYGIIYKATCLITKKIYIGQTVNLRERKRSHKKNSFNKNREDYNCKFHAAIRKYGFENFIWEVIEDNIAVEFLDDRECYWIEFYGSFKIGYNTTIGGDDNPSNYLSVRQKISNTLKGRFVGEKNPFFGKHHSEETKKKMRENSGTKGKPAWNRGKPMSQEQKEKIAKAHIGKTASKEARQKMSKSRTGKSLSEETKQKMSLAAKELWKKKKESVF